MIEEEASTITTNNSDPPPSCLQKSGAKRETTSDATDAGGQDPGEGKSDTGKKKSQRFQTEEVRTISSSISRNNPKSEECKVTENTRAGCGKPAHPDSPIAAGKSRDLISADSKILNVESELQKRGRTHTDGSNAFVKSCKDFEWLHDANTPHHPETNGFIERAVRRVKKTDQQRLQCKSGLPDEWRDLALE